MREHTDSAVPIYRPGFLLMPKRAIVSALVAYVVATWVAIAFMLVLALILHLPSAKEAGGPMVESPAYQFSVKFHPLANLLVWPFFAYAYLRRARDQGIRSLKREGAVLGALWLGLSVAIDFVGFVAIKHPASLTPEAFYVGYQPWLTFIYLVIFLSPMVAAAVLSKPRA